jgi:hypothetical protein
MRIAASSALIQTNFAIKEVENASGSFTFEHAPPTIHDKDNIRGEYPVLLFNCF